MFLQLKNTFLFVFSFIVLFSEERRSLFMKEESQESHIYFISGFLPSACHACHHNVNRWDGGKEAMSLHFCLEFIINLSSGLKVEILIL